MDCLVKCYLAKPSPLLTILKVERYSRNVGSNDEKICTQASGKQSRSAVFVNDSLYAHQRPLRTPHYRHALSTTGVGDDSILQQGFDGF